MISWKEACFRAGYSQNEQCPYEDEVVYYAYKAGVVVPCADMASAKAISKNFERCKIESKQRSQWFSDRRLKELRASEIWHDALMEEYSSMPLSVYNLCLDLAYERCHGSGFDEVACEMRSITEFAQRVMECNK